MDNTTHDSLPSAVDRLYLKLETIEKLLLDQGIQQPVEELETPIIVPQIAEILHLSVATVYSKISRGELPIFKRGKRVYSTRKLLLDYLKEGKKMTNAEIDAEAVKHLKK